MATYVYMIEGLKFVDLFVEPLLVSGLHAESANMRESSEQLVETSKGRGQRHRFQPSKITRCPNILGSESDIEPCYNECEGGEGGNNKDDHTEGCDEIQHSG